MVTVYNVESLEQMQLIFIDKVLLLLLLLLLQLPLLPQLPSPSQLALDLVLTVVQLVCTIFEELN